MNMFIRVLLFIFFTTGVFALSAQAYEKPPLNSYFYIKSVKSGYQNRGYWDQPGKPSRFRRGANLSVYSRDGGADQQFRFVNAGNGSYFIVSRNGGYVDVDNNGYRNGTNIHIWTRNSSAAQKFRFQHLGNGRWKIYTSRGRVVCLKGMQDSNGTNIHIWSNHNASSVEWTFFDYRTSHKFIPQGSGSSGNIAQGSLTEGKLQAYNYGSGSRKSVSPGRTEIEIWHMDRTDKKNPYKRLGVVYSDLRGKFKLPEKYKKESSLFLLTKKAGFSSAYRLFFPASGKVDFSNLNLSKYSDSKHILVDTKYRGKQYYHENDGYFYRNDGKITRRYDFFFHDINRINRSNANAAKLLKAIGGGSRAVTDEQIVGKLKSVLAFFKKNTRSSMQSKDKNAMAAMAYMFRNCRTNPKAPVSRWPSFQEMADTYGKYGFIPVGNCTANTQVAATLLYAAGVSADKFFVSKFHYDMSWYVEHWVLAVHIGKRWYSIDPQQKNVIRIKSVKDFKKPYWERYISGSYDYKKPFEAWLLPGSKISAVPYLGDPSELKELIAAKSRPMFFIKNRSFSYSSGGMVFRSRGTATVKNIHGNSVTLSVKSTTQTEGPKGPVNKTRKYDMVIEFSNGKYSTGKGYVHSGNVDSSGKVLNMSGEQSSMSFRVN